MSTEGVAAATKLLESMTAGDVATAFSALHTENVVHEADSLWYAGDWKGPEGFGQIMGLIAAKLDVAINDYKIFDAGEVIVMNAQITFTSKATGRSLEMPLVELYRTRNGQIVDMDIYYKDTAALIALADDS